MGGQRGDRSQHRAFAQMEVHVERRLEFDFHDGPRYKPWVFREKPNVLAAFLLLVALLPLRGESYDPEALQAYLDARVDRDLNRSIIVGVVSLAGERFFTAGTVSEATPRAPVPEDIFEIGGVTQSFTAAIAGSLVADRQLAWKQPVDIFLPEYVETPAFGEQPLRLVHLATHTSGLPNSPPNLQPANPLDPFADYTADHLYVVISVLGLTMPPGEDYRYSMLGYGLLGHVLTLRSGQSYEELVRERVGAPLGLQDTSTGPDPRRVVPGHQGLAPAPNWHWDALAGAGGLYSSARDLLRFLSAQMGMVRLENRERRALLSTHNAYAQTSMPNTMAAHGWHITRKGLGGVYWANGKTGGYAAFVGFNPATQTGCVILTNSAQPLDEAGFYVLDPESFPLPQPPPSGLRPAKELEKYAGIYRLGPDAELIVTRDGGKLYAQMPGAPRYRVYPTGKREFAYANGDVRLIFDAKSRSVTLLAGLKQFRGQKVK